MKVKELEQLARDMVGDGKRPNLFFVSTLADGIVLISRSFETAYEFWRGLPRDTETALEDRQYGVICDTSPEEDGGNRLRTWNDSAGFRQLHPKQ